jgi:hypothetical protein
MAQPLDSPPILNCVVAGFFRSASMSSQIATPVTAFGVESGLVTGIACRDRHGILDLEVVGRVFEFADRFRTRGRI